MLIVVTVSVLESGIKECTHPTTCNLCYKDARHLQLVCSHATDSNCTACLTHCPGPPQRHPDAHSPQSCSFGRVWFCQLAAHCLS